MKPTTNYQQTACRLLAGLFFFLLLAPMAAGEDASTTPTYWEDQISDVEKIANVGGGDGTSWKQAIRIASNKELAYFAQQVNKGEAITYDSDSGTDQIEPKGDGFKDYYFALSDDINLEEHYWTPIGTEGNPFKGNFDGQGYCVSGLKVGGSVEYAGLFGYAEVGTLRNIGVHLAKEGVYGIKAAGGIAGLAANISNCYVVGDGMIKAGPNDFISVGGIAGNLFGSLSNCYATIDVEGEGGTQNHVGGIVGYGENTSSVSYTYSIGNVFAKGESINYAGGICGYSNGELYSNLATNGKIEGDDLKSHPHWLIIPVFVYLFVFKTTLRLFVSLENFANFAYS